ncbi:MAG: hypothetical protein VXZ72_01230 [Chlamydiota bacterium]|nr:hypothetical protein [Chlamydiota bacterium]
MRYFLLLYIIITIGSPLCGETSPKNDIEVLRAWIDAKRQVTVRERGGNLSLSGEVRTEFQSTYESVDGRPQRGVLLDGDKKYPRNMWDVEASLLLDYRTDRTWASAKLKFDNDMGTQTKTTNKLSVARAYLGGRLYDGVTNTFDVWLGRWGLGYVFDSKIQFGSLMDGLLLRYDRASEDIGDFALRGGAFLINDTLNRYGYVAEASLLNIGRTKFYSKLSLIDWDTPYTNITTGDQAGQELLKNACRFCNLQWLLGYKQPLPARWGNMLTAYGAILYNTASKAYTVNETDVGRTPFAGYIGFSTGQLRKKRDWSFDINYQWVEAQALPQFDSSGIGRGNVLNTPFYSKDKDPKKCLQGATNYQGWACEFLYLITNNITLYQSWQQSRPLSGKIGLPFRYNQYEMEWIYAF